MKVGVYCRISKDKGNKDKSIEDQSQLGITFCKKEAYQYEQYIDKGISGTIDERPEFQRLLADIMDGKIQLIWVYDDSRIQRNPEIRYLLNNTLRKYKVQYCTHLNGLVDLYNPESELVGGIMAEFNKYFVALTKIKVKSVLRRRALSGRGWGTPPYGYTYDENGYYILKQTECRVVKKIYSMSLSGIGTDSIARTLNEDNTPTRYNQYKGDIKLNKSKGSEKIKYVSKKDIKWSGNTIRGILNNSMFFGKKQIKDLSIDVPSLFSIDYWEEVNYNLKHHNKNTVGTGGTQKYNYLLNGIITCGRCGRNYNGKTRANKKDHYYYCMSKRAKGENCGNRSINIDKIESFIWNSLFNDTRLYNAIISSVGSVEKTEQYNIELRALNKKLESATQGKNNVLELVKEGVMSIDEVKIKMIDIRSEIKELSDNIYDTQQKIKSLNNVGIQELKKGSKYFSNLNFQEQRRLVHKFVKNISVHWVDDILDNNTVRYYKITLTYNVGNIQETYTNSYGLDLDTWYNVKYDKEFKEVYFDYRFTTLSYVTGEQVPFDFIEGEAYPNFTTLVPYGEVRMWDDTDLISFYSEKKFEKFNAELKHKLSSSTFIE